MSEVEEVQEQMKADMKAMKEKMATMMEANMSMKEIMEVNSAALLRWTQCPHLASTKWIIQPQIW